MNEKQVQQHITILGVLHLVSGALFAAIGLFILVLFTSIGLALATEDPIAPRILMIMGFSVAGLMVVLSLPGMVAGYGLLKRRPWGRVLALVVGALNLFNVPVGTVIGLYTIWVLMQGSADTSFVALKPA